MVAGEIEKVGVGADDVGLLTPTVGGGVEGPDWSTGGDEVMMIGNVGGAIPCLIDTVGVVRRV